MLDFALTAVASILFVVDPLGALPAYLAMTGDVDPSQHRHTARRAALGATAVLALFGAAGKGLFSLFGLTMPAFQIAGGLILFLVALDMMRAQRLTQEGPGEVNEAFAKDDVAITPLAVPMLAGPAALSTVTMLLSRATTAAEVAVVYGAIAVTGAAIYGTLLLAQPLYRALGKTGIQVFSRVLGLILAAIAVQFVLNGLRDAGALPAQ